MEKNKIKSFVEKNSNRIRLQDNIPLKYPLSLTVEPTNKCNYQCRFCPNGDKEHLKLIDRTAGDMPMDLYRKLIDDIVETGAHIKSLSKAQY
ncbi:hypothetical protein FXB42_08825 [Acetobacterium wieringae]|uniref:Radical SAM protein n=1 Tax=Acetobacterium wieringae TaxID=52694 RepID=A0A5D0WPA9_9FIRM|nr:hypothetical protein [Acetobacterium wieringae]TYC85954.1 hypothetical protein FXB42_08825 [Acetobacterium wieringae]